MDPTIADTLSAMLVILYFLVCIGGIAWILYFDWLEKYVVRFKQRRHEKWLAEEKARLARQVIREDIWNMCRKIEEEKRG